MTCQVDINFGEMSVSSVSEQNKLELATESRQTHLKIFIRVVAIVDMVCMALQKDPLIKFTYDVKCGKLYERRQ